MGDKHLKGTGQKTDDDSDNDEEGDNHWSKDKLKDLMTVLQEVFDKKPPRRGRRSKKAQVLKDEKLMDKEWERKNFCVSHYIDRDSLIQINHGVGSCPYGLQGQFWDHDPRGLGFTRSTCAQGHCTIQFRRNRGTYTRRSSCGYEGENFFKME
jgi:hypothetical protein